VMGNEDVIDLRAVVGLLSSVGIACNMEMTGGGVATIFAGEIVLRDGILRHAIAAGPGDYASGTAQVGEFGIGPDDDGADPDAVSFPTTNDPITVAEEIGSLLVAQLARRTSRLPFATVALRALSDFDAGVYSCGRLSTVCEIASDEDGSMLDEVLCSASLSGFDTSALRDSPAFARFVGCYRDLLEEGLRLPIPAAEDGG